jgi:drug/metabolite transporter (DMT)-like permease
VLALIALGVVLASIDRRADEVAEASATDGPVDPDDPAAAVPAPTAPEPAARPLHRREDPAATRRSVILAVAAAAAFSIGLITSARLGDTPISWIIFSSRAVGVLMIAVPLVLRGRLRLSRRALPLVVVSGVLEAVGSSVYVIGAHVSPATAVVLSSQFAAIAAVSAFVVFKERLGRIQVVGVSVIAVGVTALAIIRG